MVPLVGTAVALVLLVGCSATDNAKPSARGDAAGAPAPAVEELTGGGAPQGESDASGKSQREVKTAIGDRSIVYTGSMTVRVDNVEVGSAKAAQIATTAGGFVGSEKSVQTAPDAQSFITLRIPSAKFSDTLSDLAKLGTEVNREISTNDVTETAIDLDSRIAVLRTSVENLRQLLARAKDLNQIIQLESQLTQRQQELAALEAKKRRLDDLVTFSTITLNLVGPAVVVEPPKDPEPSFLRGLEAGWESFVDVLRVSSAVLGFLVPYLVALAIPVMIIWIVVRRRRPAVAGGVATPDTPAGE